MSGQLSALYSEFLEGGYDCVDRVVSNAYVSMGQSGGGFRTWWRELYGSDENLDDNRLMRMAGRFSRRIRAWAKANGVPVIYCSPGEDQHKMGEQHLPRTRGNADYFRCSYPRRQRWFGKRGRQGPVNWASESPKTLGPT
jgi:hypothetical protein